MLVILICLCFGICNSWLIPCLFTVFKHFHLKKKKEKKKEPNMLQPSSAQTVGHLIQLKVVCILLLCFVSSLYVKKAQVTTLRE